MAQITFSEAQIIVENAMRSVGYGGGNIENAWKESIVTQSGTVENPLNLQKLRDAIAHSIIDILTSTQGGGSISQDSTPGVVAVTPGIDGVVSLNNGVKGAARMGDSITINILTDPVFMAWLVTVSTFCSIPIPPVLITGKILTGSSSVLLGD